MRCFAVVEEGGSVDLAVVGDDLAVLVIGPLLQEVDDNRPTRIVGALARSRSVD